VTCDDLQTLLHGYVDGELDLVRHLDIDRHLAACPSCERACKQLQVLQAALKGKSFHFTPPTSLRGRIESSLNDLDVSRPPRRRPWGLLALAASLAFIAFATWGLFRIFPAENERLTQELVASHVRSLMLERHLYDVESTEQHEVKPWFQRKIDFPPPVPNLDKQGFHLEGGRLDYLNNRSVAALVYHRRKHVINLFVWPSPQTSDEGPRSLTERGYQLVHWTHDGMTFWAVSDLNAGELREFADLFLRRTDPALP
jgi:anti-sigma factor RsiW